MRIAAIDIGTNSIHMIVVQIRPDLSFEVIDREKEMVRLGAGGLDGRALTPEAMHAALQVLSKFRRLAESHRVEEVIAVATSATRESENGGEFLQAVTDHTGFRPRVISGTQEARHIHSAAVYGVGGPGDVAVVIDIGGGSVEITRGKGAAVELGRSFKLGVIRLTERFIKSDPLEPKDERRLVRHVEHEVGKYLDQIARARYDRVIGTSGTILSIGTVIAASEGGAPDKSLRNRRISAKQVRRLRKEIVGLSIDKRLRVPGLEPRRADLVVAGVILVDEILRRLGATELTLCDLSLREGLVLDYIAQHRKEIAQADRYPDIRRRSVFELAERCNYWPEHSQQVARLAMALFDHVHISYERHHKHSYYLIKNGDLRGFEPEEIEIIALVARYHRQATPKRGHDGFGELGRRSRRAVRTLAAILRLAEGLDRSHGQTITGLELRDRGDDDLLQVRTAGDAELELWAAARHAAPFERMTRKPLRIEVSGNAYAEHSHPGTRVSGQAVRRRGDRRLREVDATGSAREVVERRGSSGVRHRMELVSAGKGRNQGGQKEERAHPDDVQPAPRDRLRGSPAV